MALVQCQVQKIVPGIIADAVEDVQVRARYPGRLCGCLELVSGGYIGSPVRHRDAGASNVHVSGIAVVCHEHHHPAGYIGQLECSRRPLEFAGLYVTYREIWEHVRHLASLQHTHATVCASNAPVNIDLES